MIIRRPISMRFYGEQEMQVGIDPIIILHGDIPCRAVSMVIEWAAIHQQGLLANWQRVRDAESVFKIEPLE